MIEKVDVTVRQQATGWISWRGSCKSNQMLIKDLQPDGILDGYNYLEAEAVWEFYKTVPIFIDEKVEFS